MDSESSYNTPGFRPHALRNRERANSTRHHLGGRPSAIGPLTSSTTSFYLVACGSKGGSKWDKNGFIFCDAMSMAMALQARGVGGTFLSCFDLDGYITWLRAEGGDKKIAFGMTGPERKPIFVLDDFRIAKRTNLFSYVKPRDMKKSVIKWVQSTAEKAVPGDVVNIVFESHGHKKKGLILGTNGSSIDAEPKYLSAQEFAELLKLFKDGVQVNAVNGACYSGQFVDAIQCLNPKDRWITSSCQAHQVSWSLDRSVSGRIRGSRFELAWVQSLARLPIPGINNIDPGHLPFTIQEHESYIRDNLHNGFSKVRQSPQAWSSCTDPQAVARMLLWEKIDVQYDPTITSRRRRIEWPILNPDICGIISPVAPLIESPSPAVTKAAEELLAHHTRRCEPCNSPWDMEIFGLSAYPFNTPQKIANALKILYYRGRQQSAILDVFIMLNQRGFVGLSGLEKPKDCHFTSSNAWAVGEVLGCFQGIALEEKLAHKLPEKRPCPLWNWETTDSYVDWLATMIVRDCSEPEKLFETIQASGYLGEVDEQALNNFKTNNPSASFSVNPNDSVQEHLRPTFGWWLPQGLGEGLPENTFHQRIYDSICVFNEIEKVYKDYFQVPDTCLVTEYQQASYLDANKDNGIISGPLGQYLKKEASYRRASDARNGSTSSTRSRSISMS